MDYGIIYKATNKVNGKSYIGQTVQEFNIRINDHISRSSRKVDNFHFHNALRRYGSENFNWLILCSCKNKMELNSKEIYYIDKFDSFNSGYNMNIGGKGNSGWTVSDEIRNKISKSKKGVRLSPRSKEWCSNISKGKMGSKLSKETIEKRTKTRIKNNYVGSDSWKSKKYVITTPYNSSFVVCGLKYFCEKHKNYDLNYKVMHRAVRENRIYKGYKCRYYNEDKDSNLPFWEQN